MVSGSLIIEIAFSLMRGAIGKRDHGDLLLQASERWYWYSIVGRRAVLVEVAAYHTKRRKRPIRHGAVPV